MNPFNFDIWMGVLLGLLRLTGKAYTCTFPSGDKTIPWLRLGDEGEPQLILTWHGDTQNWEVERPDLGRISHWVILDSSEEVCTLLALWHENPTGDWEEMVDAAGEGGVTLQELLALVDWNEVMAE